MPDRNSKQIAIHRGSSKSPQRKSLFSRSKSKAVEPYVDGQISEIRQEIRRFSDNILSLFPLEPFGVRTWDDMFRFPDPWEIFDQMERSMSDFHRRMENFGGHHFQNFYEVDDDGKPYFKVRFDARNFEPNDIKVNIIDNKLTINAKRMETDSSSKNYHEFYRLVSLPQSIDLDKIDGRLGDDGILVIKAPVNVSDHKSYALDKDRRSAIQSGDSKK